MRISGLASGMDTDQMVDQLMQAEKQPLVKLQQDQQRLEWKRDDYREMNRTLADLDSTVSNGVGKGSTFRTTEVQSSDESVVEASASTSKNEVTNAIEVDRLATTEQWIGEKPTDAELNASKEEIENNIYEVNLDVKSPANDEQKEVAFSIEEDDTYEDVISKLNDEIDNVTVLENDGQVAMSMNDTGSDATITLNNQDTADLFNELGYSNATSGANLEAEGTGQDAKFHLNGLEMTRSTNDFTIDEISYSLKDTGSSTVTTSKDNNAIVESVTDFVDKYNETVEKVNGKVSEKKDRDYDPLTDEQKQEMSEQEIEMWEEKAKSGTLQGDLTLSSGLTNMRQDLYTPVEGIDSEFNSLAQVGISTVSYLEDPEGSRMGKLEVDEAELRQKLQDNPQAVEELFTATGEKTEEQGIAQRIQNRISGEDGIIDQIETKAGNQYRTPQNYSIGREMIGVTDEISDFQQRLVDKENQYYKQFQQMEQAVQEANAQSAQLMQQFGGGM